jgi:uncharacterized integral membrane protein
MIKFIVGIILGVIIFVFAIQNTGSVEYTFLGWTLEAPRALVVIGVFLLGLLTGWLVTGLRSIFRRQK